MIEKLNEIEKYCVQACEKIFWLFAERNISVECATKILSNVIVSIAYEKGDEENYKKIIDEIQDSFNAYKDMKNAGT